MSIPLRGQGKPLPRDFPYKGEWLIEKRMFLYYPDNTQRIEGDAPRFTVTIDTEKDSWCFGLDAVQLAGAFNSTSDAIFAANRSGELILHQVEASTPTGELARAKRYVFRIGNVEAALIIEALGQSGSA